MILVRLGRALLEYILVLLIGIAAALFLKDPGEWWE